MIVLILIIWNLVGLMIHSAIHILTENSTCYCNGFEYLNPRWALENYYMLNLFGIIVVVLFLNVICPLATLGYWFYKLCTLGRR